MMNSSPLGGLTLRVANKAAPSPPAQPCKMTEISLASHSQRLTLKLLAKFCSQKNILIPSKER